jgi:hypothetical protein
VPKKTTGSRQFMSYADPEEDLNKELFEGEVEMSPLQKIKGEHEMSVGYQAHPDSARTASRRIAHEMTKSFGLRYNDETDLWDYDVANIKTAWDESPGWTMFDWATAAFGPARLGKAALAVKAGKGVPGQTYRAAKAGDVYAQELLSGGPKTAPGRLAGRFGGDEFGRAVEMTREGPASTPLRRFMQSPASITDDYIEAALYHVPKGGAVDPSITKAIVQRGVHETRITQQQGRVLAHATERGTRHFRKDVAKQERFHTLLKSEDLPGKEQLVEEFGEEGAVAFQKNWDFRNALTEEAINLGLLDEAATTAVRAQQGRYMPTMYNEYARMEAITARRIKGFQGEDVLSATGRGSAPFVKKKRQPPKSLTRLWDPMANAEDLAEAAHYVSTQKFAQGLGNSALAKENADVLQMLSEMTPAMAKLHRYDESIVRRAAQLVDEGLEAGEEVDALLDLAGWRTMRQYIKGKKEIPKYVEKLEESGLLDKRIDPHVIDELDKMFRFESELPKLTSKIAKWGLASFRVTKTAYNPATHGRNSLGNIMNNHLATGVPRIVPNEGITAFYRKNADFEAAVDAGILDSSDMSIVDDIMREIHGENYGRAHHLDWMGDSPPAKLIQKLGKRVESLYRAEDSVWKLDAFIVNRRKYMKAGMGKEEATSRAVEDIVKYFPTFNRNSDLGHLLGKHMPFANFTTEQARVWKNAFAEKPHLAFFWGNFSDTATQAIAAGQGMSMQDVEDFRTGIPGYDQGKLLLMAPFKVDNAPIGIDLGYIIPLASNISESNEFQSLYGLRPLVGSNPYLGTLASALTGKEAFGGRDLEPRITNKLLPTPVEGKAARQTVGLLEYMAQQVVPPLTPLLGSSGRNVEEAITREVNPKTGEQLEESLGRTIASNVFGLRTVQASPDSVRRNIKFEKKELEARRSQLTDHLQKRIAKGDKEQAIKDLKPRILEITQEIYDLVGDKKGDPEKYFKKMLKKKEPGMLRTEPTSVLRETLRRTEGSKVMSTKGRERIKRRVQEVDG